MTGTSEICIPAPLPHQQPIVDSPARFKVVRAGRRGGKTVLAEGCAIVGHGPENIAGVPFFKGIVHDLDVVWVARDYTQAGIMWHEFIRPRFKGVDGVRVNEAERTVTLEGAGTLFVISAENITSAKGMGKRLAGVIIEEAAWLDLQRALRDVILPALMDNDGWLLIISTTNASGDGNAEKETPSYFNRICEEIRAGQRSRDWKEFHFTALDNPKISAESFQALVAEYPQDSPALKQEVHAELLRGGSGAALRIPPKVIPAVRIPDHWTQFGAFDWGYNHPWVFGWFAGDEDSNVVLVDSVWGWHDQPDQIHAKIAARVPLKALKYIVAGHDLKHDTRARGETGPTLAERFYGYGWPLIDATVSRISGLNNLRLYIEHGQFRVMDTPTNRWVLSRLMAMQDDPDRMEDALKVDSDGRLSPDGFPANGDDPYDMTRYGLMSRPMRALPVRKAFALPNENVDQGVDLGSGRPKDVRAEAHRDRLMEQFTREQEALRSTGRGRHSMRGRATRTVPV